MDSIKLARALADRFQRIVPEGFHVWEDDGMLWYSVDSACLLGRRRPGSYCVSKTSTAMADR